MTTDYVSAAIAAAEAADAPATVTPAAAPAAAVPVKPAEPVAPDAQEDVSETAPAEAPAAAPAPTKAPDSRLAQSYEGLARDKATFRAEKEALAPAKAMMEAAARGDALALMAAAKIPWSKAAQQVLEGHMPDEKRNVEEPDERDKRIAALEAEVSSRKAAEGRAQVMSELQARTKADPEKFKLVSKMGEEAQAVSYLEWYFNQNGELPDADFATSMEIALEAVEAKLVKESKRWAPVLTSSSEAVTVPPSKSAVPAAGAVSQQAPKTLTNGSGAGPSKAPTASKQLKTSDDYINAAIEAANAAQ